MVRQEIRQFSAYHLDRPNCRHKLDQNEMPFDAPRPIKERLAARFAERSWAVYPDVHSRPLRQAIAHHQSWHVDGVMVGNGSDELFDVVLQAVVRPGQEVLGLVPSYGLYPVFVTRAQGVSRQLGPTADLRLPIAELAQEIEKDPTRPVIVCTPNNPTGEAIPPPVIEQLLERLEAPLLLDNAYGEFCDHDYRPLLERHRHLMIFGTFSKAWSMAALRLGYLLADPQLAHEIYRVHMPYSVNFATALAGEAMLEEATAAERRLRVILGRRPQWSAMLNELGFEVFPSEANFILARCRFAAHGVAEIKNGLAKRSIRVRDVSHYPGLAGCLRFSVGNGVALRDTRCALMDLLASTGETSS